MKKILLIGMLIFLLPLVAAQTCSVSITSTNVQAFFNEIPSINTQLQACPITLPPGAGFLIANGNTVVDINMNNNSLMSFTLTIANGQATGIKKGTSSCKQLITVSENNFVTGLKNNNPANAAAQLFAQGSLGITGCNLLSKVRVFFAKFFGRFFIKPSAVTTTTTTTITPTQSNCGQLGEQCDNRGCVSGICAAPEEEINGRWAHYNYRCIDQNDWNTYCEASGNTPPAWDCVTGPCQ